MTIIVNSEHFQYFLFETDFLENENLFQKTGLPFFKVFLTHQSLPYKTAISEANVKTNKMVSTK